MLLHDAPKSFPGFQEGSIQKCLKKERGGKGRKERKDLLTIKISRKKQVFFFFAQGAGVSHFSFFTKLITKWKKRTTIVISKPSGR